MIVPVLDFLRWPSRTPITWCLFAINLVVFLIMAPWHYEVQHELEKNYRDSFFLNHQGEFFAQFIQKNPDKFTPLMIQLAYQALSEERKSQQLLGSIALRSAPFVKKINDFVPSADTVSYKAWRQKVDKIFDLQDKHPSYQLGLDRAHLSWPRWVSYQFVHSGGLHLIGNMFFLLILGTILEPLVGSFVLILVYLFSGVVAAGTFLFFSSGTLAPLVGASGAVSGWLGLFSVLFLGQKVRYFYWLLPIRPYFGFVLLPSWVVTAMWVLSDLAGWLSSVDELGGIAYTAHFGGAAFGLVCGLFLYRRQAVSSTDPLVP